ncbi:ATP-dependent helicase/nuclease subunit A [Fructobacillus pseudoficulneus]|uniref:ATP-dependent helicase/nuclease subunit A n=1 Tax=Fructobacillus pseudoficulneus TaxID=220714 RepID=A0A3F3GRS6_9LACO|nr:helicase-exonuclease AddAB subunit AddA [Fructobacillus pseudoficulneus]GAP02355.1 ATP-dependent helicase/nuclease subunit A [Fructobacillus pseudoficulneus]SEH36450.1 DNA helicase/exodeoxyribonuclease V, subunit A [Fructobacillus pseudoficulneus]
MARQYTENQSKAIAHSGHNILVAASAGSGKTTVLIERLVRKILAGARVDQFLIVTFTSAAAAEMKERLEVALNEQIQVAEGDQRRFLLDQLALLPVANVSTIDSFALKLIDTYYYKIGLDPSYRLLADEAELTLLKNTVVDAVFAEFYDQQHPNHLAFLNLVNNFADPNHDGALKDKVLKLADFALARPDGNQWLEQLKAESSATNEGLRDRLDYRELIQPGIVELFQRALKDTNQAAHDLQGVAELDKSLTVLLKWQERLQGILAAFIDQQATYDDIRALIINDWPKSSQSKAGKIKEEPELGDLLDEMKAVQNTYFASKGEISTLKDGLFRLTEKQWQLVNQRGDALVTTLVQLTQAFLAAFTAQKRADNLLDFADAELLSLELLAKDDVRDLVQRQFEEILIDEYQDINRLQETFLKRLSNGHNMYMVGDVKQSIYGFRQADPSLFTGKYFDFAKEDNQDERIELAENFRSENNVTTVINQIFTQLMDEELGDIPYQDSAKLIAAASYPDQVPAVFELDLIEQPAANSSAAGASDGGSDSADDQAAKDAQELEKRESQYRFLVEKIQDLVKNGEVYDQKAGMMRPVKYSDIAILTRSKTGYIDMVRMGNQAGIPIQAAGAGDYYQVMEVYLTLDLLRVIDNPHQDIPLAAVLRSPIFDFKENDLAKVRLADQQHDFYTALQAYAKTDQRAEAVLSQLRHWRQFARQNDLVGLLLAIYQKTGWLDYVGGLPGGAQRQANLHALYEKAGAFQDNGQAGLYAFIRYIEEIQKNDKKVGEVAQEAADETVALMTIHGSKGLEFPIVILPELEKEFNTMDLKGDFLVQKDAGVGLDFVEPHAKVKLPTLPKYAVKEALKRQAWSEEMRLFYVALTRAKQQLFLLATVPSQEKDTTAQKRLFHDARGMEGQYLAKDLRLRSKSYLDWLLITLARLNLPELTDWLGDVDRPYLPSAQTPKNGKIQVKLLAEEEIPALKKSWSSKPAQAEEVTPSQAEAVVTPSASTATIADLSQKLSYQYPNQGGTRTAAYQSVSEIKSLFEDPDQSRLATLSLDDSGRARAAGDPELDEEVLSAEQVSPANHQVSRDDISDNTAEEPSQANQVLNPRAHVLTTNQLPMPAFDQDGQSKPAPTAVGTATHLILQLVDFTKLQTLADLQVLLTNLVDQGKVEAAVAALVDLDEILDFLQGEMAQQIAQHAATLHREATFAMLVPANQVYPDLADQEPILIHGIIDGYYLDESSKTITLFDYKTDYLPRTAGPRQKERLAKIRRQYTGQVRLYQQALQREYPDYMIQAPTLILLAGRQLLVI